MTQRASRQAWVNLLRRLHFYIGLFVGPFIFIAALSGSLYVATPQIEAWLYRDALTASDRGTPHSLADQIAVARQAIGHPLPVQAVRPAPHPGETTRVMFREPSSGSSETRGLFIDPVSLEVKGDMTVYGTSGILPLRLWIDNLHRSLWLEEIGRNYSELAASWMWVAALGGIALWLLSRTPRQRKSIRQSAFARQRRWHTGLGGLLLVGLLLFSATGLTWSRWAGDNVNQLRAAMNWMTPQVNASLSGEPAVNDPHAGHHGSHHEMAMEEPRPDNGLFDSVLAAARQAGIDAARVEIRPAMSASRAWTVSEIDRRWPTQVDEVAVNPYTLTVTDQTRFSGFPLMAKLTRWGVDFHMGILFGLANQLALVAFGAALCVLIVLGYRMWWRRRPVPGQVNPTQTLVNAWRELGGISRGVTLLTALLFGMALPVMGGSLLLFLAVDLTRWYRARMQAPSGA
ncbi:PepSY domain-containing protein [Erwinia sp. CPCC 100877]|nr:PepSY domain-containing protein [Erwinia sp. CPCC 100877]